MHDEGARTYLMTIFHMKSKMHVKNARVAGEYFNACKTNKTYLVANTKCKSIGIRCCCWEIFHMKLKNACKKCNVLVSILYEMSAKTK